MAKVKIISVDWDIADVTNLPKTPFMLDVEGTREDILGDGGDPVSDALSDKYGFCVFSASYNFV